MNSLVIKSFIHSLIKSVILFLPQPYGAATPKRLEIALPVINRLCHSDQDLSKSRRASKFDQWFKLKGLILPVGEASAVEGLRSMGLPRLVYI